MSIDRLFEMRYPDETFIKDPIAEIKELCAMLEQQHREINGETDQQRKERKYRNAMFPQEDREPAPIGLKNKIKELEGDLSVMKLQRDAARDHEKRQEYIRKQQVRLIQKREAQHAGLVKIIYNFWENRRDNAKFVDHLEANNIISKEAMK